VTATFLVILLAAAAAARRARAAAPAPGRWGWRLFGGVVFVVLGIHAVLLAALGGDGLVFPGKQLSPEIANVFGVRFAEGRAWWAPEPVYSTVVLLAHLALLLASTKRANWLRPLPATAFFVLVAIVYRDRADLPPRQHLRAERPGTHADGLTHGYLTLRPTGAGAELVFAVGGRDDVLVDVVHRHAAGEMPPRPKLRWTGDGAALVFSVRGRRLFAVEPDGSTTGWLPPADRDWPPSRYDRAYESVDMRRKRSRAERDVAEFLTKHGGIHGEGR